MTETSLIPGEAEIAQLRRLQEMYATHRIVREARDQNAGVRYAAYGMTIVVKPHTIITRSLDELEDELARHAEVPAEGK